jgi:predicted protein tyrosine phosphatase
MREDRGACIAVGLHVARRFPELNEEHFIQVLDSAKLYAPPTSRLLAIERRKVSLEPDFE